MQGLLTKLRIGPRLGIGFGIVLLIMVAMIAFTISLNAANKAKLTQGLEAANAKSLQAAAMKSAILEAGLSMRNLFLRSDADLMNKEDAAVKAQMKVYDAAREKLAKSGLSEAEKKSSMRSPSPILKLRNRLKKPWAKRFLLIAKAPSKSWRIALIRSTRKP